MTLFQILKSTGFDVSEVVFPDNVSPTLPFVLFECTDTENFVADNQVYKKICNYDIRLCNDGTRPNNAAKRTLENVLNTNKIPWQITSTYQNTEESMYETIYEIWWRE